MYYCLIHICDRRESFSHFEPHKSGTRSVNTPLHEKIIGSWFLSTQGNVDHQEPAVQVRFEFLKLLKNKHFSETFLPESVLT